MKKIPSALFVIDVGYENIAITGAKKLGIPVIAVVDTNNSFEEIDYFSLATMIQYVLLIYIVLIFHKLYQKG